MFCPKCGQLQSSDALRFCSRCGFALGGVNELLSRDGAQATTPPLIATGGTPPLTPRRKGMRQGGAIMLVGLFLIPMLGLLHPLIGAPGEFTVIGAIILLAGLLRLLIAAIFEDKSPPLSQGTPLYAPPTAQGRFDPHARTGALPPGKFRPAQTLFAQRVDTSEISQPPASVTDHTTRLLADQDDSAER
ncbi:MAG: hypothetical protein QOE33_2594 [Acidobacteriota bacterium]|nr:hypothetical protein [Acidobacteriota bacterium]